ncbi:Protein naked cuticle 1, partial [Xenotaenia resolanae]
DSLACGEGIIDEHYRLEVALPPEKTDSCCVEEKMQERVSRSPAGAQKQLRFEELECAVSVEEDNRQEWTFTLYDFDNNGKVTREDITSLLHTIYEVVDASVNHSPGNSKTLRVKLSVAPDSSQRWRSCAQEMSHSREKNDKCIEDPKSADKKSRALLR